MLSVLLSSALILLAGENVFEAWYLIFVGALGSRFAFLETLVKMAPLIFTGLAIVVAFRTGFWNIGGEGQLYLGALAAAALGILPVEIPATLHIALVLAGGFVAGGLCAALQGYLKAALNVDAVVTTLLSNYVIILLLGALLQGPWRDAMSGWPHSPPILESARFPFLLPHSRFHLGIVLAVVAAGFVYVLLEKTVLGYRIKAVGGNPQAAFFGGIPTVRVIVTAAFLSGGLAGLAGVGEVCGIQYYLLSNLSPGYGYSGIVVAVLGGLHPFGVIMTAFYFAVIITGGRSMSRVTGVPVYLAEVIQGITLLSMLATLLLNQYRLKRG
jgi:simple sugar transport system permease protein